MRPLIQSSIQLRPSLVAGLGVFARKTIHKGDVIEEAPVLILKEDSKDLHNYHFQWSENPNVYALPLGYGALYNHADTPNAKYQFDPDNNLMIFIALYDIPAEDEIFVNYGDKWFETRKMLKSFYRYKLFKKIMSILIKSAIVIAIALAIRWLVTHLRLHH